MPPENESEDGRRNDGDGRRLNQDVHFASLATSTTASAAAAVVVTETIAAQSSVGGVQQTGVAFSAESSQEESKEEITDIMANEAVGHLVNGEEKMEVMADLASIQVGTFAEGAAAAAVFESNAQQQQEEEDDDDDDDLVAMKRAAYAGRDTGSDYHPPAGTDLPQSNQLTAVPVAGASAEAVHAQAQLVTGASSLEQGFSGEQSETLGGQHGRRDGAEFASRENEPLPPNASRATEISSSVAEQATEATVIDSEPLAQHPAEMEASADWKVSGEAEVFDAGDGACDHSLEEEDQKIPARATDTGPRGDTHREASDCSPYDCPSSEVTVLAQDFTDQPAEVVAIQHETHPREFIGDRGTRAEFLGQEAECLPTTYACTNSEATISEHSAAVAGTENIAFASTQLSQAAVHVIAAHEDPEFVASERIFDVIASSAEAVASNVQHSVGVLPESSIAGATDTVVIPQEAHAVAGDCTAENANPVASIPDCPVTGQSAEIVEIQEQQFHPAEFVDDAEAVLVGSADYEYAAPVQSHASVPVEDTHEEVVIAQDCAPVEQQGEVVEIQDDFHPGEFVEGAQADFVGTDNTYAIPSSSDTQLDSANVISEATVMEETSHGVAEAAEGFSASPTVEKGVASPQATVLPEPSPPGEDDDDGWPVKPAPRPHVPEPPEPPAEEEDDRPEWLTETPPREAFGATGAETSNVSSDRTAGTTSSQRLQSISNNIARGLEFLVGDAIPPFVNRRGRIVRTESAAHVVPRSLLPWSVIYSPPTRMWVATLQTNQRALDKNNIAEASKSLRAFSLPTEKAAVALAKAWTPPRMLPKANICHMCRSKFALLRRPCHCRNCGVVICKECSVVWLSKMIPETYNFKKENSVNVCLSCDWLSNSFRLALLEGDQDKSIAIHATGNINLHAPFGNVKGELFYPVHCAVLGESLSLLKWLVDENCCPIKSLRVSGGGGGTYTPIVTSKGRSLLGIAMENRNVEIVRYLVVRKGISLAGEQDITFEMLLRNLDKVLRLLPENATGADSAGGDGDAVEESHNMPMSSTLSGGETDGPVDSETMRSLSDEARNFGAIHQGNDEEDCKICFDSKIDCVATPCGHQICCLTCSERLDRCPVCSAACTFIRTYRT